MKRVKVGWTIPEHLVDILKTDEKVSGRKPGWHLETAIEKHLRELSLLPCAPETMNATPPTSNKNG